MAKSPMSALSVLYILEDRLRSRVEQLEEQRRKERFRGNLSERIIALEEVADIVAETKAEVLEGGG